MFFLQRDTNRKNRILSLFRRVRSTGEGMGRPMVVLLLLGRLARRSCQGAFPQPRTSGTGKPAMALRGSAREEGGICQEDRSAGPIQRLEPQEPRPHLGAKIPQVTTS